MCSNHLAESTAWELYPQNLALISEVDAPRINDRISQLSKELFTTDQNSLFGHVDLGSPKKDGSRDVKLEQINTTERLNSIMELSQATSMFFLHQNFSWSSLCISEEHFRRLFMRLGVHPSFLEVVQLFRKKLGPVEQGFSSIFVDITNQAVGVNQTAVGKHCSYYIGYNIKYVAKHGRVLPNDPYSVREIGIYQHFSSSSQRCNWVVLQASPQLKRRIMHALESCDNSIPAKQFLLHSMILLHVSEDWREYLIYLEKEFSNLVDKGFFTKIKGIQSDGDWVADFSDLRKLHILTDKMQRLAHILKLNIRVGTQFKKKMTRVNEGSSPALNSEFELLQAQMDSFLFGQETNIDRIETLVVRSSGVRQLIQSIQEIRAAEASKQINDEMQKLTEQGIKENALIKGLTEQSTRDTRYMMAITLISAIFLPATFVATLFGSNFFDYSERDNRLTIASNFWIYLIIACGFSGATVLLWYVWRQRADQRHKQNEVEVV